MFSTEEEGGTVRFLNKLDISSNKRTDALVQLMITPTMQDTPDFYELVITLEDAYDPENKLTISFYRGTYDTLIGMVKAQAPGQVLAGYNANNKKCIRRQTAVRPFIPVLTESAWRVWTGR